MKAASLQTKISELGFVSDGFVGPSGDGTLVLRSACDSKVGVKSGASHWRSEGNGSTESSLIQLLVTLFPTTHLHIPLN